MTTRAAGRVRLARRAAWRRACVGVALLGATLLFAPPAAMALSMEAAPLAAQCAPLAGAMLPARLIA